jgi:hypothetical protein
MLLKCFTVYDNKAGAYMQPFYTQSRGQALRSFADTANDQASTISRHAGDFTLFQIGEFNDEDASFVDGLHVNLGCAIEFKDNPQKE